MSKGLTEKEIKWVKEMANKCVLNCEDVEMIKGIGVWATIRVFCFIIIILCFIV